MEYQPNAAGIASLTLSQTLDNREQMAKALLTLSGENSKVQIGMTENCADQTLKELNQQAKGLEQSAVFTMTGSLAGISASLGTFAGAVKTMPQGETPTVKNSLGVEQEPTDSIELKSMGKPVEGAAQIEGQKQPDPSLSSAAKNTSAANENNMKTTPGNAALNRYFTDHGTLLANAMKDGIQSFGALRQAKYTAEQAEAKSIEVIAQGLSTVMNAQGQMLSSAVGNCDTSVNNTNGVIATISQVSAVRG